MHRTLVTALAAATALGLAALAYGAPPEPNAPATAAAPNPADPRSIPPEAAPSHPTGTSDSNAALEKLVPPGMTARQACGGFSTAGDCALVLHVAHNLDVSFADLKSKLAGGRSLTAAISEMKPGADPQAELDKAETQARSDRYGVQ